MPDVDINDVKRQLTLAAETLLPDYSKGGELTEFTALDHEDFHIECTCS